MEARGRGAVHLTKPQGGRRPFAFSFPSSTGTLAQVSSRVSPLLERLFALDEINGIYDRVSSRGGEQFIERVLDDLGVACNIKEEDLARIPANGPLVVVANHPFGAIEGIALAVLLRKVRRDIRVMANFLLDRIPELRDLFICVDPFGGGAAPANNLRPMRQAMRWLAEGGALAIFPAGEVAHLDLRQRQVVEPPWSPTIAGLIRRSGASVVPIFFEGCNGPLFQALGLLHPRLRTAMLPRELMSKSGSTLDVRIGTAISSRRLAEFKDSAAMTAYLRQRLLLLRHRTDAETIGAASVPTSSAPSTTDPVVLATCPQFLAAEIARFLPHQLLAEGSDFRVYLASAAEAPNIVREIGRLREFTYRATGEGTGKPIDLDAFDQWYQHLFVWDAVGHKVVGAYRLGPTDQILRERGPAGLYITTLFNFKPPLLHRLNPALELGRAFVQPDYQKNYAPLLLLWKGIARFVYLNPRYKTLFGPVSISNDYRQSSRQLMVEFLESNHLATELTPLARARNPFRRRHGRAADALQLDPGDLDDVIADIEPDHKGVPVLLRQYLKLGAQFISFNVDTAFGNAIDALMLVDLTCTDPRILSRYMGRAETIKFLASHGRDPATRPGRFAVTADN